MYLRLEIYVNLMSHLRLISNYHNNELVKLIKKSAQPQSRADAPTSVPTTKICKNLNIFP